jgi:hypothetical protein
MTTFFTAGEVSAEIKTRLLFIRTANGFETEIGRDVMMGRRKIPGDDKPPCTMVLEGQDDVQDQPSRMPTVLVQQQYVIDGFDTCDPDNPNDKANAMIRDIKRAIFKDGATFGGKVKKVSYLGRDIGPREDGVALVQARVLVGVEFVEDLANP